MNSTIAWFDGLLGILLFGGGLFVLTVIFQSPSKTASKKKQLEP